MSAIKFNGVSIAYQQTGTGEPVLLLHSSANSNRQWRSFRDQFGDRFQVCGLDLFGYGETDPWPGQGPLTLADEAELVAAVMDRCGEPVHLVGHSYGGAVALRVALDYPTLVRSLTVIEPVAFYLLKNGGPAERPLFQEIRQVADAVTRSVACGDFVGGMAGFVEYWNGAGAWKRIKPDAQADLAKRLGKVALDFSAIFSETTRLEDYAQLKVPTLILCGTRSPKPTRAITRMLAETITQARHRTIRGAGHMLPLTHADAVGAAVDEHLAQSADGRRGMWRRTAA